MKPLKRREVALINISMVAIIIYILYLCYTYFSWIGLIVATALLALIYLWISYTVYLLPIGKRRFKKPLGTSPRIYDFLANLFMGHDIDAIYQFVDWCQIRPSAKVLDIASGTGYAAINIASIDSNVQVAGLDLSKSMLKRAKLETERRSLSNVFLSLGDAEQLPYKNETFDVTLSIFCMNLVPDREKAIAEMERVTKKGGRVGIQIPNPMFPHMRRPGWYAEKMAAIGLENVKIYRNALFCSFIMGYKT